MSLENNHAALSGKRQKTTFRLSWAQFGNRSKVQTGSRDAARTGRLEACATARVTGLVILALTFLAAPVFGQTLTTLVSFNSTNGANPQAELLQASDGNFYGTTTFGGSNNLGTVFKMTSAGALTTLVSFNSTNGSQPYAGLIEATDGNFYGTTLHGGGTNDDGLIFKMTPAGNLTPVVVFTNKNGALPYGTLVQGRDGNFYGTTSAIENHSGEVYRVTPDGTLTTLAIFNIGNGATPQAGLVQGNDGNFYGTCYTGGPSGAGTVFKITTNGVLTTLVAFDNQIGVNPVTALTQGNDGNFYGSVGIGTIIGHGMVFKVTPAGVFTPVCRFSDGAGFTNGFEPHQGVMQGSDGNFYGVTAYGGVQNGYGGLGTIFKTTPTGALTALIQFNGANGGTRYNGYPTTGKLIQGRDGNFYGINRDGGTNGGFGIIYRLTVPLSPVLKSALQTNNQIGLTWSAVSNLTYQAQFKTNWNQPDWLDLGIPITATNGSITTTDTNNFETNRFYRVRLMQ